MLHRVPLGSARRLSLIALCGLAPLLTANSANAAAASGCAATATTKAFSAFGDTADYSLLPGGDFETGATGWALGGASIVSGSETLKLGGVAGAKSLAVPAKARVVSPKFCVGVEHPTFRLAARLSSGTWGTLVVKLRFTDSAGNVNETAVGAIDGGSYAKWKPSPSFKLATTLPLWAAGQTLSVQVVLDPEDFGGAWQVDGVYIDPYRRT